MGQPGLAKRNESNDGKASRRKFLQVSALAIPQQTLLNHRWANEPTKKTTIGWVRPQERFRQQTSGPEPKFETVPQNWYVDTATEIAKLLYPWGIVSANDWSYARDFTEEIVELGISVLITGVTGIVHTSSLKILKDFFNGARKTFQPFYKLREGEIVTYIEYYKQAWERIYISDDRAKELLRSLGVNPTGNVLKSIHEAVLRKLPLYEGDEFGVENKKELFDLLGSLVDLFSHIQRPMRSGQSIGLRPDEPVLGTSELIDALNHSLSTYRQLISVLWQAVASDLALDGVITPYTVHNSSLCIEIQEPEREPFTCQTDTTTISRSDDIVYSVFTLIDTRTLIKIEWSWYQPSGELYLTESIHSNKPGEGKELDVDNDGTTDSWYSAYHGIYIDGEEAENYPGNWTVTVNINEGRDVHRQQFTLQ